MMELSNTAGTVRTGFRLAFFVAARSRTALFASALIAAVLFAAVFFAAPLFAGALPQIPPDQEVQAVQEDDPVQEDEPVRTAAEAFLKEARALYEIHLGSGLESFGIEMTIYGVGLNTGERVPRGRISRDITVSYEWEAPDTEEVSLEGVPNQLRRSLGAPLRGIWKDIAGACVFPDIEGDGVSIEGTEEGMILSLTSDDGDVTRVFFDPSTKLVLKEERTLGDMTLIIAPSYVSADGFLRLESKIVSATGGGGGGAEGSYVYSGFREIDGFSLPTQLAVNLGQSEIELGFKYLHINGEKPESDGLDPEVVKAMVMDFEKAYSKWSKPEKLDGMKKLAATEDPGAAKAIAKNGLKDRDLAVREEAAVLLGRMGCREVVGTLTKAMKSNEKEVNVYLAIITALGDIGDPKAIPYLSKDFWNQKEAATGIRMANAKINALGQIRSRKSVDALIDMLYVGGPGAMAALSGSLTRALEGLTGQRFGWDRDRWKDWWKKNRSKVKLEEDK